MAYIAERNPPKTAPFFSTKPSTEESTKPGSKFELREDWGETYKGGNPSLCVASVEKELVSVVSGIPESLSAGQVQWAPGNEFLIFTGWSTEPRRLGIIHCYNRPCAIYSIPLYFDKLFSTEKKQDEDKKKKDDQKKDSSSSPSSSSPSSTSKEQDLTVRLTTANIASRSPRFSADGKILVYLAANQVSTHNSASKLLTMDWKGAKRPPAPQSPSADSGSSDASNASNAPSSSTPSSTPSSSNPSGSSRSDLVGSEERVIIDIIETFPDGEETFPGLFLANLPPRCFIEERKIMFSSQWRSLLVPLLVDLNSGSIRKITVPGCSTSNLNVQDVRKDVCALFDGSELNRLPFNFVGRWDGEQAKFRDFKVTPHPPSITEFAINVSELGWENGEVPIDENDKFNGSTSQVRIPAQEYILTTPSNFGEGPKVPIILFPHGGPHGANTPIFLMAPAFFASIGYAVVMVNYRGSTGFGKQYVDALPGHVGTMDVEDCRSALAHVVKLHSEKIDTSRVYVMGGSHGGFLTGHLLATKCPVGDGSWKAGCMINAVTNIAHCVGISDIPDWCHVESGEGRLTGEALSKMFDMSPISKISNVSSPTLIVLGAADKRVPISQSIEYYHTLKSQGTKTRLLKYPGAGHGIVEPEQEADYLINTALWFEQHTA